MEVNIEKMVKDLIEMFKSYPKHSKNNNKNLDGWIDYIEKRNDFEILRDFQITFS